MSSGHPAAVQNCRNIIALLQILCACHDLNRLCPYVDLADDQFVRIGMALDLLNVPHNDLFKIFVEPLETFYLCSRERHGVTVRSVLI